MATAEKSAARSGKTTSSAASHMDVRPAESPTPEASDRAGQFGPLPLVIRPSSPIERKVRPDRRGSGSGSGRGRTIILRWLIGIFLVAGLAWALASALAQQPAPKPAAPAPAKSAPTASPKPQQQQQAQQQQPSMPVSTEQALYLIRSTLLTLNDANRSGNYTVLRDLATPDFQARNTAADLSQSFSDLRRRNFDLYGAALLSPQLTALPALDQRGFLRLAGYFPTRPQQINFDLLFQNVANQWRLFGISIATPDIPSAGR
jgi:hypothetical protein